MAPEYGATAALFPVDDETLRYLRATGRGDVRRRWSSATPRSRACSARDGDADAGRSPSCSSSTSTPSSRASPARAARRTASRSRDVPASFHEALPARAEAGARSTAATWCPRAAIATTAVLDGDVELDHGAVVIAAITSCTNTSNPSVMVAAGLLAKKAVERGLEPQPYVKTSLAPGSRVVTDYLERAGLLEPLDALRLQPRRLRLHDLHRQLRPAAGRGRRRRVDEHDLAVVAVLSGNRNFEGRIHPQVRASYLASPPLVVAYALAGHGRHRPRPRAARHRPRRQAASSCATSGRRRRRSREAIDASVTPELFEQRVRARSSTATSTGARMAAPDGRALRLGRRTRPTSTSRRSSPTSAPSRAPLTRHRGRARAGDARRLGHDRPHLARRLDPAATARPAATCIEHGVEPRDFNSFGARRGNHEVMVRGTFANIRLRNALVAGREGGVHGAPARPARR